MNCITSGELIKRELQQLKDWTFTLSVAAKSLPGDVHVAHYVRLRDMQDHFRRKLQELETELENL